MIKGIIFDWGSVLAPSDKKVASAKLSKKYGVKKEVIEAELGRYEAKYCALKDDSGYFVKVGGKLGIPADEIKKALNKAAPNEVYRFAKKLTGYKLFLMSDQVKSRADFIKSHYDLSFFDKVFFSCEIGYIKNSLEAFKIVLRKIKLKPSELVFVDDNKKIIANAKKAGINGILFKDLKQLKKELRTK